MATWADKWNNKRYIFWIALVLSFFMGFRNKSVGIDTKAYYNMFQSLTDISIANKYNDSGFYKIAYLLMKIKNDPYFPILVYSILSNFLVTYRLWDFRKYSSYNYAILRYVTLFYFYSINCMRQFVSMSLVLYATKYLEEKKYYKYIVLIIIASYFHIAALTAIGYIALEKIRWKNIEIKQRNLINIMYIISPAMIFYILALTRNRLEPYFDKTSLADNYNSFFLKILLFVIYVFIMYFDKNKKVNIYNEEEVENSKMTLYYYFIGMVLNGFGFIWAQFERIGYYYYIYALPYTGQVAKSKKYKMLFRTIILFIVIRSFYLSCDSNSMGQMPYLFKWE